MTTMTSDVEISTRVGWPRIVGVAAASAMAATAVWLLWDAVGGVEMAVRSGTGSQQIGIGSVIVSSLVIAMLGGALLRWWQSRSERATRRWTLLAVGIAVVSLITPTSALSLAAGLALVSLHLVVAVVVIAGLRRR
ncbi:peptidoglycan/LPS O-acetylase OafA/YrhL [Nocardioides luteus]|uniref:Uncharacterized protein n=1 Tax=Nocardioides luteus TaxID=1844 RepID=A0ABQ5SU96_9ACTN|nr:DUF6069 family protein [Nocardioides luteus]MDR7309346.1 peptidoglycan/LPS O-acetylase OafA/YrhL [Nocardioides luteus]GGR50672.1 hypothetical protein GCM10010197_15690 [Nocardioides luteus]GLJ67752.1 hypothetical protein GCM10017579_17880 [Nocardioides luteus]